MSVVAEKVCILVIIYGKELVDSTTLSSLLKFDCSLFDLVVINNGPEALSDRDFFYHDLSASFRSFELLNKTENMPLSIAYNSFIDSHSNAQKYVFLDDDTEVTESFIYRLADTGASFDVEVPKIVATDGSLESGSVQYPVEDGVPVVEIRTVNAGTVFSIGSGLVLTHKFIEKFRTACVPVFDNHYALYGVDYSLFRNVRKLLAKGVPFTFTSFSSITHSLSRLQKGTLSEHTKRERLYDIILSARHYPDKSYIKGLIKSLVHASLRLDFSLVVHIISTFVKGYHPRCKPYITTEKK
ncbi:TPA: hypothetical protein I8438_004215 [Serratia marcescens]|uniref:Glycosyltransferase family 2 protein n=3 Tax=Serratia marcescens TaxID=615 RepID=A0AB33FKD5_SERMA|nr:MULTISPECIES: glycosyltransferase family 2 protein [Serratia]AKL40138.1 hypothetical protein AB188_05770 [Serratia marcescens]AWL67381.1 glycosyltransferase family 2 protein [Serratia marcescens]TWY25687.1 hypothetical protein FR992_27915 [Serratia marcescens]TYR70065.1 hypothetical protein FYK38_28295 [Serratia marcescens]UBI65170.1 hypothetical protein GF111_04590 [Serratia sp. HRI]